jgi:hypothetical protein
MKVKSLAIFHSIQDVQILNPDPLVRVDWYDYIISQSPYDSG